MKRAAISIAAGARKTGNKKLFKHGKTKTREEKRRFFLFWVRCSVRLSGEQGARRQGESSNIDFNKTRKTFNSEHKTQETLGL